MTTVLKPLSASPVAMEALVVVLPTPPLPDVTTIVLVKPTLPVNIRFLLSYRL